MEKVLIGKVVNVVGLKGELKVYNYSDGIEIYEDTPELYLGDTLYSVKSVREQKGMVVLGVEGIGDRDAAERMRGTEVFVTEADLPELPEGQFYVRDLIGMEVYEDNGELLGKVTDVIQNTAQDVFEIERQNGRQLLIPRVPEFVLNIDGEARRITVHLIDGMLDL